jgi:hypothetical protein
METLSSNYQMQWAKEGVNWFATVPENHHSIAWQQVLLCSNMTLK